MSTLALDESERSGAGASAILGNLDLLVLALALPAFVAADWPLVGYGAAAALWIAGRFVQAFAQRRAARSLAGGDRQSAFKATAISSLGRAWMMSLGVLLVGLLADREDGLAAALLLAALFTVQLATAAIEHRGEGKA